MPKTRGRSKSKSKKKKCPKGKVVRKGYTRTSSSGKKTRVPPTCIKDLGAPGKGPKLYSLEPGLLRQFGYSLDISDNKRHQALKESIAEDGYDTTMHRLVAVSNLVHRTQPKNYNKYRKDINWMKKTFSFGSVQ